MIEESFEATLVVRFIGGTLKGVMAVRDAWEERLMDGDDEDEGVAILVKRAPALEK